MAERDRGSLIRRFPALILGIAMLAALSAFFLATGALFPREIPAYATSTRQITGMALMLILLPSYVVSAAIVAQRRSLGLVEHLRPLLPDSEHTDAAAASIRGAWRRAWIPGALVGLAMGAPNTDWGNALASRVPAIDLGFAAGQTLLWLLVGVVLATRAVTARVFAGLGERVELDLFRLDALRPLARAGLADVVLIAGALALSPLQSLDAHFRWFNYHFALLVTVPASAGLLLLPLRSIRRRILAEKQRQLERVDASIAALTTRTEAPDVAALEPLLAHRDRLHHLTTWLLGSGLFTRLAFYLIVPPLAWVGAALVESVVDRFLAG